MAFLLVALAGLLIGVAPASLPLYSVLLGSLAGRAGEGERSVRPSAGQRRGFLVPLGFVLGIATADALLGALFALSGTLIIRLLTGYLSLLNLLLAAILAVSGLVTLRLVRLPWIRLAGRAPGASSFGGAYVLGIPFGLSTCPACTPLTLPILFAAGATGVVWLGALLLFVFGMSRGLPLLLAGWSADSLARLRPLARLLVTIEYGGGVLLLLAAAYFAYQSAVLAGLAVPLSFLF